jgi:hypothetical protein
MFDRWKTPPKKRNDHRRHTDDIHIDINGDGNTEPVKVPPFDETIIFSGYLLRPLFPVSSNSNYVKTWKEMWMVLRSDNTMSYYEDEYSTKPMNVIQIQNIDVRVGLKIQHLTL